MQVEMIFPPLLLLNLHDRLPRAFCTKYKNETQIEYEASFQGSNQTSVIAPLFSYNNWRIRNLCLSVMAMLLFIWISWVENKMKKLMFMETPQCW